MPFYDERDSLWESVTGLEFTDFDERNQLDYLFTQILDDVEFYHIRPQESEHWQEFKDFMGFVTDGDAWDWESFKEWYDVT